MSNKYNPRKPFILAWRGRERMHHYDTSNKWNYNHFTNWNKAQDRYYELLDNPCIEVKWIKSQPSTGDDFSIKCS